MSTSETTARPAGTGAGRRRTRALAIAAATIAALALWALARYALGIEVASPEGPAPSQEIGAVNVVIAAAVAAVAGWGLLALLERFVARAHRIWLAVALLFTALSLGAPLFGAGIDAANRVVLAALHLVVAAVVVPPLYRTSRAR